MVSMDQKPGTIQPDKWKRIEACLDRLMDGEASQSVLRDESDAEVIAVVERLWASHQRASRERFLDEQITLVRKFAAPPEPCFSPGKILGARFTIERLLGVGGMGEVYLAKDGRLHETVAIKTIRRDL